VREQLDATATPHATRRFNPLARLGRQAAVGGLLLQALAL